ncbi:MAG: hypothetical protein ACHQAX_09185 [Gammaproteobacteria bacterium]
MMSVVEEYSKRGGLRGVAAQYLKEELQYALTDANHPLRRVVEAFPHGVEEAYQNNKHDEVTRLILHALENADSDRLQKIHLVFGHLPTIGNMVNEGVTYIKTLNYKALAELPTEVQVWASMEVQCEEEDRKKSKRATDMANIRHEETKKKHESIRALWASGKYKTRDECAEAECENLGMKFEAARNALKGTPNPMANTI